MLIKEAYPLSMKHDQNKCSKCSNDKEDKQDVLGVIKLKQLTYLAQRLKKNQVEERID